MAKKTTIISEMILDNVDVQYDEFINEINIMKEVSKEGVLIEAGRMTDHKAILIQTLLERKYDVSLTSAKLYEAINMAATQSTYSSAFDWIESKEWDGQKRLWNIASKVFGNDDPDINKALGIWIVNLVSGAYSADTGKFQYTLDIIGQQGTGKTSFLKALGEQYYTDQFMSYTHKDSFEIMLKNLIVNDDEMEVTEISREKAFKKFVSTSEFTYRPAYGRNPMIKSRHFVIARTTNDYEYLTDIGGNRRVIPLIVEKKKIKTHALSLPKQWYSNVLGEAKEYYEQFETIEEINAEMRKIDFSSANSNLNIYAEIDDAILVVVEETYSNESKIPVTGLKTAVENYLYLNDIDYDSRKPRELAKMISAVMTREGYVKKNAKIGSKQMKCFVK
ncbi:virulence-associated E family protein [Weissella ceti]|uniref:Virulence-associated protein E-like domain-containing protein n=1 Tax=Weissella ceti TaxID=759620 RepID=A0A088GG57_9LACO|nr:virulence-associated E family protein [Weissella ceti]AIM63093.1 hypothetical protein WS74_0841 [Weissella ceti]